MSRNPWKSAVLIPVLVAALLLTAGQPLHAQNATTGGDQQPQPDAQTGAQTGAQRGGPGGGRRGGGVRGTVVTVSGGNISVKDEAGTTWTVITTDNTRIMRSQQVTPLSSVQTGDELMAMGVPDADKHELHAMMVMDVSAADVAKARADMGKTYIVGRVTAIDDTKVTVLRTDKVSQTITLDETTSLHKGGRMNPDAMRAMGMGAGMTGGGMGMGSGRRGGQDGAGTPPPEAGEAITLADVKIGDSVIGIGAIKGGSFVPTDLRVQQRPEGGGPGGPRRGPGSTDAPPAAPPQ